MPDDFEFSERSIFFASLGDQENPFYTDIRTKAERALNNNSLLTKNHTFKRNTMKKYQKALQVLKKGIEYERANEKEYFSTLLDKTQTLLDPKIAQKIRKKLQLIFKADHFNYIHFIDLINNLLLGSKSYKETLAIEQKRMQQLDKATTKLLEDARNGEIRDEKTHRRLNEKDVLRRLRNEYLERHQMQTYSNYFEDVIPTVDNLISNFIEKVINQILNSQALVQQLQTIYLSNQLNLDHTNFTAWLIRQILIFISKDDNIAQILLNNINNNDFITKMINQMSQQGTDILIQNYQDSIGRTDVKAIQLNHDTQTFNIGYAQLGQDIIDNQQRWLNDPNSVFTSASKKNQQELKKLLDEAQEKIKQYQEAEKTLQAKNKTKRQIKEELKDLQRGVIEAKRRLGQKGRDIIRTAVNKAKKSIQYDLVNQIKDNLMGKNIDISGPTYSEIIDTVAQQLITKNLLTSWSGPKNCKADSIAIKVNTPTFSPKNIFNNFSNNVIENIGNVAAKTFNDTFNKTLSIQKIEDKDSKEKVYLTSLQRGRRSLLKAMEATSQKVKEELISNNKNLNEADQLQAVAEYMKNTMLVTETMKTFNTYYNEYGFGNGSIGANVSEQITNYAQMFSDAGMPMEQTEIEWLNIALVNCSPHALGDKNREPLEKFLSALAGFAVFDEGSAEIAIIAQTAVDEFQNPPKILHLYRLDGLYYPGSFILQRIYNKLEKIVEPYESINNDGAHIRAVASESIIQQYTKKISNLQNRWTSTYEKASTSEYTSIEITFLSGLLDISKQLGHFTI